MKLGLEKRAQEDSELITPEEKENATEVTCISNCKYSQNPEKRCMLKSISLQMPEEGTFICGQYDPVEVAPEEQGMAPGAGEMRGEVQSQNQLGLSGAKIQ